MMKSRNYLLLLLSLTLTGMPALAVDYVACREMLRTKNEMMLRIEQKEEYYQKIKLPYEKRKFFDTTQVPENIIAIGCPKNEDEWCRTSFKSNYVAKLWVEEEKKLYGRDFILGAKDWIRGATRVNADMKKAGCPYE